jgi:ADP-ribose pyrophosphatase
MKVIETTVLYEGKLRGVRDVIETEDGRRHTHETIEHPGAVVILPILPDGRIACISQYRHSLRRDFLELPAGMIEKGEVPHVCAAREIREEIGMAARELIPMGAIVPAPGFCSEVQYLFVGRDLYEDPAKPDDDENISLYPMTVSEMEQAIVSGAFSDAKSIALLMKARLQGLL